MNPSIDHERCSELLRPFVEGVLDETAAAQVGSHLDACDRCRAEHAAVVRLLIEEEGLRPDESALLRRRVLAGYERAEAPETADVVPLRRGGWRPAQVMGAAALLLIGVVFVANFMGGGVGFQGADSGGAGGAGQSAGEAQVAEIRDSLTFRQPQARKAAGSRSADATADEAPALEADAEALEPAAGDEAGGAAAGAGGRVGRSNYAAVRPLYVRGAGRLDDKRLTLVGRYGLPLVLFPQSFTAAQALDLQEDFLLQLANAAETSRRADQVIECGAQVIARPDPALPALATFGTYEGEPTFVLAFAWSDSPDGRLDRYMVWTWPALDCEALPTYRAGKIGT